MSRRIVSRLGFTRLKVIGRTRGYYDQVQSQRSLVDSPKKQRERVMRWRSVPSKSLASCNATTLSSANRSRIDLPSSLSPAKQSPQAGKTTQSLSSIGTLLTIVRVAAEEVPGRRSVSRYFEVAFACLAVYEPTNNWDNYAATEFLSHALVPLPMSIAPFSMLIAMLPLAAYLTLFGAIRLLGRPMVTTGGRDIFAVAIAISGLIAVGPAELFFPTAAATLFGIAIWPVLAFLYFLIVLLIILSSRPRLVIYGRGPGTMAQPLLRAAQTIDADARCDEAAGQIELPRSGVYLRLEGHRGAETAEVFAYQTNIAPSFWNRLLRSLRAELANEEPASPRRGGTSFAIGVAMLFFLSLQLLVAHEEVVQGFRDWLWR